MSRDPAAGAERRSATHAAASGGHPPDWFAALGRPLTALQRRRIGAMIAAYPLAAGGGITLLADWSDVAAALQAIERDDAWWDYEEGERELVWLLACQRHVEDDLAARLAAAGVAAAGAFNAALDRVLPPAVAGDAAFRRAVAGVAALAVHQHALASFAGVAATHLFQRKHRLFAEGRLPLGYHAGRYFIY